MQDQLKDIAIFIGPENHPQASTAPSRVRIAVGSYMLVSSTMLIINKVAIHMFPFPFTLLSIQLFVSVIILLILKLFKRVDLEFLEWSKAKAYFGVTFSFLLNILTNMKALQHSNVETVIVFRTCTTLAIAYGDFKYIRKSTPSIKEIGSILLILFGAITYVQMESKLKVESVLWASLYFVAQCFEVLYVKYHMISTIHMSSWTRSLYANLLALPFIFAATLALNEHDPLSNFFGKSELDPFCIPVILLSCVMGLMVGWLGFVCREKITATAFSVVGNVNKLLTVAINCTIWDQHASLHALFGLLLSIVGGALYSHFTTRVMTAKGR
eukprot:TRINITY_DN18218_c0_g1_i1.p1 TRINITY_DN18218_c0_g1~~TRINITY_DN18218_c0_g1_i1.p1  ORF type:complete len:327 (-),score=39.04 TRINITY_DN18218_c0_g1_i1:3-983(-)